MSIKKIEIGGYQDRFWYPRICDGMPIGVWWNILRQGRFRVNLSRMPMGAIISALAPLNSSLALLEKIVYGRKIAETQLVAPPIFIIGHWRSGTTLLHEYMIHDPNLTFSDTYSCFTPSHFLVSGWALKPFVSLLMPKKRPIDNMAFGLNHPQEDEFALCSLGAPTPYLQLLFANDPPKYKKYLAFRDAEEQEKNAWLDAVDFFLRSLTVQNPKRIVLKSPPHTARIRTLLQKYPDAKFVHIHRDPYKLFPSTYNLWMRLSKDEGLQVPTGNGMEEFIFSTFEEMYDAFESDLPLLKEDQFCDIAFKELTSDPVQTLRKVYEKLNLPEFENVEEKFRNFAESQREYKKNKFELNPNIAEQITQRWSGYIEKYGYGTKANDQKQNQNF